MAEQMEQRFAALEDALRQSRAREDELNNTLQRLLARDGDGPEARRRAQMGQAFSPIIDTRMLTKPKTFSGKDEDWAQWSTVTRAYCGALDANLLLEMTTVEEEEGIVDHARLNDNQKQRSCSLFYILAMLLEGRAQTKVSNCVSGHGLELWRRLVQEYESKVGSRSTALLVKILTYDFSDNDVEDALEKWENLIKQYDATVAAADQVRSSIKIATVISKIPKGSLRDHLMINSAKFPEYNDLRKEIREIVRMTRHLDGVQNQTGSQGPAPMEIGAVDAKGKGKGKGKGKDDKMKNVQCYECQKYGHYSRDCRSKKGKGKGKGDKTGDAGKKGIECHRCGKTGQVKKDCHAKKHKDGRDLNQVEEAEKAKPAAEVGSISVGNLVCLNAIEESGRFRTTKNVEIGFVGRTVRVGIDSGAGVTVWPTQLCDDYPTQETDDSRKGVTYASAGDGEEPIRNKGERVIKMVIDGQERVIRAQVARVRKPLLAVSEMCDAGHDLHFLHSGEAYAVHSRTGAITKFARQKGVYEVEAEVPRWSGGPGQLKA